jgi:hypothetical protein
VPMCKASDRKCALSLFGNAVSTLYMPFQGDHKVMAHNGSPTAGNQKQCGEVGLGWTRHEEGGARGNAANMVVRLSCR